MILSTSCADAVPKTIDVLGEPYVLTPFIGQAPVRGIYVEGNEANGNELPQGFLVEQPCGSVTRAHFHEHNQFQVFVAGSMRFDGQTLPPHSCQFAYPEDGRVPIHAGAGGLEMLLLRFPR